MFTQRTHLRNWLLFSMLAIAGAHMACNKASAQAVGEVQLADAQFESIQVLTEMPAEQMGKVMNIMSESLGVGCAYCHDGYDFAKEGIERKDIARDMLNMTFKLNQEHFRGVGKVSCNTCHRGSARPDSSIVLHARKPLANVTQPEREPAVEDIWRSYMEALGGKENLESFTNRKITAQRVEPDGRTEPETLWQDASGKSKLLTEYANVSVIEGFDGTRAWKTAQGQTISLKKDESALIRREAILAFPFDHRSYLEGMQFQGRESIEDREVNVLARTGEQQSEKLLFDADTGLLVRSLLIVPTVLGEFVTQVDYREYKEFANVKIPTRVEYAMPGIRWAREVRDAQVNIEMDETLFREN